MPAPGYSAYVAPEKYAQIAWILGFGGHSEEERRERLFARVEQLLAEVDEPRSLAQAAASSARSSMPRCPTSPRPRSPTQVIRTNPRIPLIREIV